MILCGVFVPSSSPVAMYAGDVPVGLIAGLVLLLLGVRFIKDSWREGPEPDKDDWPAPPPKGGKAEALMLMLIALPLCFVIFFAVTRSPVALLYGLAHGAIIYMWPMLVLMALAAATVIGLVVLTAKHGRKLPRKLMDVVARRQGAAVILMFALYLGLVALFF
jgi:hypothetical protein